MTDKPAAPAPFDDREAIGAFDPLVAAPAPDALPEPDVCVGGIVRNAYSRAAARIRELEETQRKFGTMMHEQMERAERAEQEAARLREDLDRLTRGTWSKELARLSQEAAALRMLLKEAKPITIQIIEFIKNYAENKATLADAKAAIDGAANWVIRIDAALKEGK